MSQRRLTRQQQFRIDRVQAERQARAQRREQHTEETLTAGTLGPESIGRVIAHYGVQLLVAPLNDARPEARQRCHRRAHLEALVTGDEVVYHPGQDSMGVITAVLPRRSVLVRPDPYGKIKPVAANIDHILLVIAPEPTPSAELIDRYLVACAVTGIRPLIVLNKSDLLTPSNTPALTALLQEFEHIGYDTCTLSARGTIDELTTIIGNQTVVFVGQSGVGKSSLINALLPDVAQRVNALSEGSKLGQHTTTTACWFDLPAGGALIDSPGIRDFGLWHLEADALMAGFIDIAPWQGHCRFRNCQHGAEPGCALKNAVAEGALSARRFRSLMTLLDDAKGRAAPR